MIKNYKDYKVIKDHQNNEIEDKYSKYRNNFTLCLDEVCELFQENYESRFIINYTYEILLYKLFELDNFELYQNLCDTYSSKLETIGKSEGLNTDKCYDISYLY